MASFRLTGRTRKVGFVVLLSLAAIIIITSGVVLVRSAKLHTGDVVGIVSTPMASALTVTPNSKTTPLATSETNASATLQGASPSANSTNTGGLNSNGVSVEQVKPSTKVVCDTTAEEKFMADYQLQKAKSDAYHNSMLKALSSEGQLMISNEASRYRTALTKLKTTLNGNLVGIACPAIK